MRHRFTFLVTVKTLLLGLGMALLYCLPQHIHSQSLEFVQKEIDVGRVDDWSRSPAVFVFHNVSDRRLAVLRAESPPDVRVSFPRQFIPPGGSDTILAWYVPREPGLFKASFSLLNSVDEEWTPLRFSGEVVSWDACPDPSLPPGSATALREVRVLDSITGQPLHAARVSLLHNDRNNLTIRTGRSGSWQGVLRPGLYEASIQADGYRELRTGFYLNLRQPGITFLLPPLNDRPPEPAQEPSSDSTTHTLIATEDPVDSLEDFPMIDWQVPPSQPLAIDLPGRGLPREWYSENNLVFLIDVSSSMRSAGKMERLRTAVGALVAQLRDIDRVTLLTYASRVQTICEGVQGSETDSLMRWVNALGGRGSTYGITGLSAAYDLARKHYIPEGNNQLILATDGEFNSPGYSDRKLEQMMRQQKDRGIILSVIGFGQNEAAVKRMALLASEGGGSYLDFRPGVQVGQLLLDEIKMNSRKD